MPTYRVNYEIVQHTLYVNVEADSKNAAAEIVRNMDWRVISIGKCPKIAVVHVEQYFAPQPIQRPTRIAATTDRDRNRPPVGPQGGP
jgi:hypothetical protein